MWWESETRTLWLGHSSVGLRVPIIVDIRQAKLALGITCPRHRAIWKRKLGWFGRWIPDLEWQKRSGEWRLVNVRQATPDAGSKEGRNE